MLKVAQGLSIRIVVPALILLAMGCKDQSPTGTPGTAPAAATPVVVVGHWAASGFVAGSRERDPDHAKMLLEQWLLINPDKTFLRFSTAGAQVRGTWTQQSDSITLVLGLLPGIKSKSDTTYKIVGDTLVDDSNVIFKRLPAEEAAIKVTPQELIDALRDKSAPAKYHDKLLEIEGTIININPDLWGTTFMFDAFILSAYPVERHVMRRVASGQKVRIKGRAVVESYVAIRFADVELLDKPVIVAMSAADLARQWKANARALRAKYAVTGKSTPLLLSGKLVSVAKNKDGYPEGLYIGDGDAQILCRFSGFDSNREPALLSLKAGDSLELVAELDDGEQGTPTVRNSMVCWK